MLNDKTAIQISQEALYVFDEGCGTCDIFKLRLSNWQKEGSFTIDSYVTHRLDHTLQNLILALEKR